MAVPGPHAVSPQAVLSTLLRDLPRQTSATKVISELDVLARLSRPHAIEGAEAAHRHFPHSNAVTRFLAGLYHADGKDNEAVTVLQSVRGGVPTNGSTHASIDDLVTPRGINPLKRIGDPNERELVASISLLRRGEHEDGFARFQALPTDYRMPSNLYYFWPPRLLFRYLNHFREQHPQRALEIGRRVRPNFGASIQLPIIIGMAATEAGSHDEAASLFSSALSQRDHFLPGYIGSGYLELAKGNMDSAKELFGMSYQSYRLHASTYGLVRTALLGSNLIEAGKLLELQRSEFDKGPELLWRTLFGVLQHEKGESATAINLLSDVAATSASISVYQLAASLLIARGESAKLRRCEQEIVAKGTLAVELRNHRPHADWETLKAAFLRRDHLGPYFSRKIRSVLRNSEIG